MRIPSRTRFITAQRPLLNIAVMALAGIVAGCSDTPPSQLTRANSADSQTQQTIAEAYFGLEGVAIKPANPKNFKVSAGTNSYSDQQLLVILDGQLIADESTAIETRWVQTSGPEAIIINPNDLVTDAILPAVTEPEWITLGLYGLADRQWLAQDQVAIRVLPSPQSLLTVKSSADEFLDRVTIDVSLSKFLAQSVTFRYITADGTAQANLDYLPLEGTITLSPEQPSAIITIDLLGDAELEKNEYFALNFNSPLAGQQKAYVTIRDDDGLTGQGKPNSTGPITESWYSISGSHGPLRANLISGSNLVELVVTDPCLQRYAAAQIPQPSCRESQPNYEAGQTQGANYQNLYWQEGATGTYHFSVNNPGNTAIDVELLLFWGAQSTRILGSIPAGAAYEFERIDVTDADFSFVLPPPSSSSTSSSSQSSSSSSKLNIAELCFQGQADCSELQTDTSPYTGATLYLDPDYQEKVRSYSATVSAANWLNALKTVGNSPTAIWIDKAEMILDGDPQTQRRSLKNHLQRASEQQFSATDATPLAIQVVLRNAPIYLPNYFSEATYTTAELQEYNDKTLVPLVKLAEEFPNIRIIVIIEPNLLPDVIKYFAKDRADVKDAAALIAQAVSALVPSKHQNIYTYLGIGHASWIVNEVAYIAALLQGEFPLGEPQFRGFATNVASYSPTQETYFTQTREKREGFYMGQTYLDELDYIDAVRTTLKANQIDREFAFIVDTSRNGWGGPQRPTIEGGMASRLDQRYRRDNWCNIQTAGIGAAPIISPVADKPYIDAYSWIKQPGYSDGNSTSEGTEVASIEQIDACDPRNSDSRAQAPAGGHWFTDQFTQLIENAWPSLITSPSSLAMPFMQLGYTLPPTGDNSSNDQDLSISGAIEPGAQLLDLVIFVNGKQQNIIPSTTYIAGNSFNVPLNTLSFDTRFVQVTPTTGYDDSHYEIRVVATDSSDVRYEDTLFYSTSKFPAGTLNGDLIVYERGASNDIYSYDGDDLLLPKIDDTSYVTLHAGAGNDVVYLSKGNVYGGDGDDRFYLQANSSRDTIGMNGELGNDTYFYAPLGGNLDNLVVTEPSDPAAGIDTLVLNGVVPDDIAKLVLSPPRDGFSDLTITLSNGDTIRINGILGSDNQPGNSIEIIRFDGQLEWGVDDILKELKAREIDLI